MLFVFLLQGRSTQEKWEQHPMLMSCKIQLHPDTKAFNLLLVLSICRQQIETYEIRVYFMCTLCFLNMNNLVDVGGVVENIS